jgi:hypothetical protein
MSASPVLDFTAFQQEKHWEHFCHMVHNALDKVLAGLKDSFFAEKPLALKEMSDLFQGKKQEIASSMLQEFIQGQYARYLEQQKADCPYCGKTVSKNEDSSRTIETLLGSIELNRPYFHCRKCKQGFVPLDEALELSHRRKQDDLQQLALDFTADVSFERAQELFEKSTRVSFSDHRMHDLLATFVDEATVSEVIPPPEEIERRIDQVASSEPRRPVVVVATDGAHTKIRPPGGRHDKRGPGKYKEAKGFRIYMVANEHIVQLASWHQVTEEPKEITEALKLAANRIPKHKVRIGLLGDGAHWLWRTMTEAFPQGRQILDYYHCSEYIHKVAELQFADDPNKALHWVESTMARLFYKGGISHVIGGLKRMQPRDKDAKEQIQKTITYLTNNKGRTGYRGVKIGGYPIGSGGIESANRFICHTRLKRSGTWWLETNCNNMLKLRCSIVNGTFEVLFDKCAAKEKARRLVRNA